MYFQFIGRESEEINWSRTKIDTGRSRDQRFAQKQQKLEDHISKWIYVIRAAHSPGPSTKTSPLKTDVFWHDRSIRVEPYCYS